MNNLKKGAYDLDNLCGAPGEKLPDDVRLAALLVAGRACVSEVKVLESINAELWARLVAVVTDRAKLQAELDRMTTGKAA